MTERPWGRRWDDQEGKRISIHHFHVDHNATCLLPPLPPPPPPPPPPEKKKEWKNICITIIFFQFLLGPKKNRRQRLCKIEQNIRVFHSFLLTPLSPPPPPLQFFLNQPLFFKSSWVDYIFISGLLSQEHLKAITYAKRIYGANRVQIGIQE